MAIYVVIWLLVFTLISTTIASDNPLMNQTLSVAIQEMQKANYFAFVMLLNLVQSNKIPTNITFLMPNNRVLAKAVIPENDVLDFLLRHSIPSPLRFDHINHFPTGSIIPSSEPEFMLRVSNNGRRSFFLNNAKLVSPDICITGSSVRCHGIDKVLTDAEKIPSEPNVRTPITIAPPPAVPPPPWLSSPNDTFDLAPAATPQPAGPTPTPKKSGSSCLIINARLTICLLWVFVLGVQNYISHTSD